MPVSRPTFRLLVAAAAALFLACQGVAVAKMWTAAAPEAPPEAAMELCSELHGEPRGSSGHDEHCESSCQHAAVSSYKTDTEPPAAVVLPFVTAYGDLAAMRGVAAPAVEYRPLDRAAPPLSILHCCLRN